MKSKEAIAKLIAVEGKDLYQALVQLYRGESEARIKLRAHGAKPTEGLVGSVVNEMEQWITKVARGTGLEGDVLKQLLGERSTVFAKYRLVDPVAKKQLLEMRRAYQSGRMPIEVLTAKGLDAITNMMIGQIVQGFQEARERMFPDKPSCSHGVKARFCKNQESYSRGVPQSVEDVQFYCKLESGKCDWRGK